MLPTQSSRRWEPFAAAVLISGFLVLLARTAWVCDDAYLTLRTVDNLLQGFGPRWNVDERVQVYTHPAWMMLLTGANALTGEAYYSTLALGALFSVATIGAVTRAARPGGRVLALAVLCGSKAFVDFSTSGLENPLTHLLLVLFAAECLAERPPIPARLVLVASLLALSRLDALVLVAPALGVAVVRGPRRWDRLAAAALPALAWEGFSVLYYGSLLPNTAYAKLSTGIPAHELAAQGWSYLANSLRLDPILLPAILAGLACGIALRRPLATALSAGLVLHVAYVVSVGGDFMSGRFLTPSLVVAAQLLAQVRFRGSLLLGLVVAVSTAVPPRSPWRSSRDYGHRDRDQGIADERGVYFQATGLLAAERPLAPPQHPRIEAGRDLRGKGRRVKLVTAAGFNGYYAGPEVHLVDRLALGDPLLARLPVPREWDWRVGHYERSVPAGYVESLTSGRNEVEDPGIARLYDRIRLATRGPLLAPGRLNAIVWLNTRARASTE